MDKKRLFKVFVIKSICLYIAWMIVYNFYLVPDGRINDWMTSTVVDGSVWGLKLLGFNASSSGGIIYVDNKTTVLVSHSCNGLSLYALYAGFLICFPGKLKYKFFFISVGIFLLCLANMVREVILVLNYKFFEKTFDFNHHYTYSIAVYLIVFVLWRFWLKRYSAIATKDVA